MDKPLFATTISARRFGTAAAVLVSLVSGAAQAADCREQSICVSAVNQETGVELHARNLREFPITLTLRVLAQGADIADPEANPADSATVTWTLAPRQSKRVLSLDSSQGGRPGQYRYSYEWTVGDKEAAHDDEHLYRLPYARGKAYRVLQAYASRFSHTGLEAYAVDFDMPVGTAVHAARDGVVARVEESHSKACIEAGCERYANYVIVLHDDGTTGEYFHLMKNGALVKVGDNVVRGQKIGLSGNTGYSTTPHLHFAVYRASEWGGVQSIPVRFQSAEGIITRPRRGAAYQAN